jgi:radical SAM protein (TIGR01212 family)
MINVSVPPYILNIWGHDGPYNDYARFIKKTFGQRIQKICLDGGFTCPNRDGTLGIGGCTYCNGISFSPSYLGQSSFQQEIRLTSTGSSDSFSILNQLSQGIDFFSRKYPRTGYAGYFQSYSGSYGSLESLQGLYEPILTHSQVRLVIIATRPDLISQDFCSLLVSLRQRFNKPLFIELGVESVYDQTLDTIHRHHTMNHTIQALDMLNLAQIPVFAHIIFGLPGETKDQQLDYVKFFNKNPVAGLKIHHLQVLKDAQLSQDYSDIHLWNLQDYLNFLCEFLSKLNPEIIVDRFINEAPLDQVIAPRWGVGDKGVKNYHFVELLRKALLENGVYQGVSY